MTPCASSPPPRVATSAGASGLEYDNWLTTTAPAATRVGRSAALGTVPMGDTVDFPVNVHNWSAVPQSGTVSLTLPANFTAAETSKPYGPLAPGADAVVTFAVTNTDATLPTNQSSTIGVTTTNSTRGPGSENVSMSILPKTTIAQAPATPTLDGVDSPGEYAGSLIDIGRIWEGGGNCPAAGFGTDCGTSGAVGGPTSTYARAAYRDDALYFYIRVRDEFQSYAVTPAECVGHWLADSVEILIDPRGRASDNAMDTANTFKLGIFPFTNDPTNSNGNGANGPCWARDADNHQGFSTGPLAATVDRRPERARRPGVLERGVGREQRDDDRPLLRGWRLHARGQDPDGEPAGRDRPRAHGPEHHALRQRQHRGRGLDHAAPHRQQRPAGVVDVRQRPVRSVPLGPRDPAGLHPAAGSPDHPAHADAREPAQQRGLAADDRPVGPQRRADLRSRPGSRRARDHHRRRGAGTGRAGAVAERGGGGHGARVPL